MESDVPWSKRLYRWSYWLPRDTWLYLRYGRPRKVIYFGGAGFGDDLLLGTVLHELRTRGESRLAVVSRLEELFRHAEYVDAIITRDWRILQAVERFGGQAIKPIYYTTHVPPEYDIPARNHIITTMCHFAGIRGRVALRTYLSLTDSERAGGRIAPNQAVIQSAASTSTNFSPNKVWVHERHQAIVDRFHGSLQFIQLGSSGDPPLARVIDRRGKTTARESAAILSQSKVCVTYVGFLMHLARAVECRSVVIFGGRERPDQSGYVCNENLYTQVPCAPCWLRRRCLFSRECMTEISAEAAIAAVERVLARGDAPLETSSEEIPNQLLPFSLPWIGKYELPPE